MTDKELLPDQALYEIAIFVGIPSQKLTNFIGAAKMVGYNIIRAPAASEGAQNAEGPMKGEAAPGVALQPGHSVPSAPDAESIAQICDRQARELAEARETIEGMRQDAEIGRKWRENSSLEEWFPYTAEELVRLRKQLAERATVGKEELESVIREYCANAECDGADGEDEPLSDRDRKMIREAIDGLLGDQEWDELWGRVIERQVQARLAERAAVPEGWRPIETAPKDGTEIILCRGDRVSAGQFLKWTDKVAEYAMGSGVYLGESIQGGGECWMSQDGGFSDSFLLFVVVAAAPYLNGFDNRTPPQWWQKCALFSAGPPSLNSHVTPHEVFHGPSLSCVQMHTSSRVMPTGNCRLAQSKSSCRGSFTVSHSGHRNRRSSGDRGSSVVGPQFMVHDLVRGSKAASAAWSARGNCGFIAAFPRAVGLFVPRMPIARPCTRIRLLSVFRP